MVVEKQPNDTPRETRHNPSTRMSGGAWFCPVDPEKARIYLEEMARIGMETLNEERKEMLSVFASSLVENTDWMKSIGIEIGGEESISPTVRSREKLRFSQGRIFLADFPELAGSECAAISWAKVDGKFRAGAALFKALTEKVQERRIPILWETAAAHLLTGNGEIIGVKAMRGGKEINIKARRGVILTCGGFEFNDWMKENYLRVSPVHFYGCPANTGDGIKMAMEVGADLWHMNIASWRVTMKIPGWPVAFGTQRHEEATIFVDRRGKRFTNERVKMHAFGYELTNYDCYRMCYPKVPCYWIFDEKRRKVAPLASYQGICNPPGGVRGEIHYVWSADNQEEIDRGWILKAGTVKELGDRIQKDPDNRNLMDPSVLEATVKQYNEYCREGEDLDFHKPKKWLEPLQDPPYYAMKLWPGGPNTQGGPRRNVHGQVMHVNGLPIPRLYSAGELGSVWGMLYNVGGNVGECIAFGRISGTNAASEKRQK
jgi:succinate dehydrogenase/fumarate reductase flavoprotein subunit